MSFDPYEKQGFAGYNPASPGNGLEKKDNAKICFL